MKPTNALRLAAQKGPVLDISDIHEGHDYQSDNSPRLYCRHVEMIADSPSRPGGKVVSWNTDGFDVAFSDKTGKRPLKRHGKCGIATFAAWADRDVTSGQSTRTA